MGCVGKTLIRERERETYLDAVDVDVDGAKMSSDLKIDEYLR